MTDNEIIKAVECCTTNGASCKDCPAFVKVDRSNCKKFFKGAIDLINRQKAEKEALINGQETLQKYMAEQKAEIRKYKNCYEQVKWERDLFEEQCKTAKAEAIKEFAERLKKSGFNGMDVVIPEEVDIDNLVKEMVGNNE